MSIASVQRVNWFNETGILMVSGDYSALVLPQRGANLIELKNSKYEADILRHPQDFEAYMKSPALYGIPVLFPPNRIEDGTFEFDGRKYEFPINEASTNNHLHGFLNSVEWDVEEMYVDNGSDAIVALSYKANPSSYFYKYYPHEFIITIKYVLNNDGLLQEVTIKNTGSLTMPVGLGFHTAINIPFHEGSTKEDYRFRLTVDGRWELNDRMLPTGNKLPLNEIETGFVKDGILPIEHPFDNHYNAAPMKIDNTVKNAAVIEDLKKNTRVVYEVGESYKHWMVYNGLANRKDFICPEPQTWLVNAPNSKLPVEITGLIALKPDEVWTDTCRIYIENR